MHQKLIKNEKLFTKEMTDVFTTEIIVCPCCGFVFASQHDLRDSPGFYECSNCAEDELTEENRRLKRKVERYEKALMDMSNK